MKIVESLPSIVITETAACVLGNSFYVVGAGGNKNELWKYDDSLGWVKLADMPRGRSRHCAQVIGSNIYVLGGWADKATLRLVLKYDITQNKWSVAGRLTHAVESAACVSYKNSIYIFGGDTVTDVERAQRLNYGDTTVAYAQKYDTTEQNCSLLTNSLPAAHRLMEAVLYNDSAILIAPLTSFVYHFESNTWQERSQFKSGVDHFALSLHDQTLYLAGGGNGYTDSNNTQHWIGTDYVKSLPLIDLLTNKQTAWKTHAKLPGPSTVSVFTPSPLYID